jgi:hypothetical protein
MLIMLPIAAVAVTSFALGFATRALISARGESVTLRDTNLRKCLCHCHNASDARLALADRLDSDVPDLVGLNSIACLDQDVA